MNPSVLSAQGIVKRFGATTILDQIDVTVRRGEVLALVGPSGCGKSTLLNILSGLLTPDAGQLAVDGVPATQVADWRSIAYMFQEDRLLASSPNATLSRTVRHGSSRSSWNM